MFELQTPRGTLALGNTIALWRSFGEMGKLSPGDDYPQLMFVPFAADADPPQEYFDEVAKQAAAFAAAFPDVSEHTRLLLGWLGDSLLADTHHHPNPETKSARDGLTHTLAGANYRPSDTVGRSCASCSFFDRGVCRMFDDSPPVMPGYVCDEWTPAAVTMSSVGSAIARGIAERFNPNHDPSNGEFTEAGGSGGGSGGYSVGDRVMNGDGRVGTVQKTYKSGSVEVVWDDHPGVMDFHQAGAAEGKKDVSDLSAVPPSEPEWLTDAFGETAKSDEPAPAPAPPAAPEDDLALSRYGLDQNGQPPGVQLADLQSMDAHVAAENYRDDSNAINDPLRTGVYGGEGEISEEDADTATQELQAAAQPLTEDTTVYRMYAARADGDLYQTLSTPGATINDKGFMSTSTDADKTLVGASGYRNFGDQIFKVAINVPAGTPVTWLNHPTVSEALLMPGTTLRIDSVEDGVSNDVNGFGDELDMHHAQATVVGASSRSAGPSREWRSGKPAVLPPRFWGKDDEVTCTPPATGLADTYHHPTGVEHDAGTNFPAEAKSFVGSAIARGVAERFNPNHDPSNGEFTEAGAGGSAADSNGVALKVGDTVAIANPDPLAPGSKFTVTSVTDDGVKIKGGFAGAPVAGKWSGSTNSDPYDHDASAL
ncbi:MAG TPA: ADP-ribosyltransferase, partial [Gaiellaceae bacterium]|nr:ADP-ribosyltransferase [Gaiellaceae bacterium]